MAWRPTVRGAPTAIGVCAFVLAGCGSSSHSGPNLAKGLSAAQLASQSARQVAALTTLVLGVTGTGAVAVQPTALGRSSPLGALGTGTPIPLSGSGPVMAPNAFSLALTVTVGGSAIPVTLTQLGGHVYAVALGQNVLLPTDGPIVNLKSLIIGIIHLMSAPATGATATLDGIPSTEVTGTVNGQLAASALAPLLERLAGARVTPPTRASHAALVAALSHGTVHDWVRVLDLRPARVEVTASIPSGSAVSPALEHASVDMTFNLSDFNQPQTITAPTNPTPMTTKQLESLIDG